MASDGIRADAFRRPLTIEHRAARRKIDRIPVVGVISVVEKAIHRQGAWRAIACGIGQQDVKGVGLFENPRARPPVLNELAFACDCGIEVGIDQRQRTVEAAHRLRAGRRESAVEPRVKHPAGALECRAVNRIDERGLRAVAGHEVVILVAPIVLDDRNRSRRRRGACGNRALHRESGIEQAIAARQRESARASGCEVARRPGDDSLNLSRRKVGVARQDERRGPGD